ncbi:arylsulfatase [Rhodopirellula sp. JC740]|uniref:Arylsulfatase n=1 Tax=Rhodopirellula halodulae TaxID=2894198 RepID=A0ABS8NG88_9BACT|nr:arylsulfatase [Rhodopirellula sp. JC740]MCC9642567.1 arylsulfatase [Rhodopirellula sp. JC740]
MHLRSWIVLAVCLGRCILTAWQPAVAEQTDGPRPNVILVVTDDQGYGDMSCHGNPWIKTPHLNQLASESVRLDNFHVDPVCTPTRAALMTGRYCTRVGAWAVTEGRQLLDPDETTMAEVFQHSGYRTGMFGKWHLGDPPPFAPRTRGFQTVTRHMAGGVDEIGNPTGNDYFDDTYFRDGVAEKFDGYCTDIWFDETIRFVTQESDQPFFVYLPTNAMHSPYRVADEYSDPFTKLGFKEQRAKFYGMIANFDENLGRLLSAMDDNELRENTLLIFMSDNGTAQGASENDREDGFNAGMRGKKGSVYDGGHRVACFARWPNRFEPNRRLDDLTVHRDWLPTLMELCKLDSPRPIEFDGRSMASLLLGQNNEWPDRELVIERQRDDVISATEATGRRQPAFVVMNQRWRLVRDELYDIQKDPGQFDDIADQHPKVVERLRAAYNRTFADIQSTRKDYVRFPVGRNTETKTITVRDWHPTVGNVIWKPSQLSEDDLFINGFWEIDVERAGRYRIELQRYPDDALESMGVDRARLKLGTLEHTQSLTTQTSVASYELDLPAGPQRLQTWLRDAKTQRERGAYHVKITRLQESTP